MLAVPVELDEIALLLDVDGTLLDLAATPREVFVPESLRETLIRLQKGTDNALALVSGRRISDLDLIFAPLQLAIVGGHGAEIRVSPTGKVNRGRFAPLTDDIKRRFAAVASANAGILIEDKGFSVALHYRLAPEWETFVHTEVAAICESMPDMPLELLPGKAVLEIKSTGFDKGTGVRQLMRHAPFAGRRPVFIGDDTTDEAAFAVLPELNGVGISVGRRVPGADACLEAPADVRQWLEQISHVQSTATS